MSKFSLSDCSVFHVVALLGVFVAFVAVAPSALAVLIAQYRIQDTSAAFSRALTQARSRSLQSGYRVTVCAANAEATGCKEKDNAQWDWEHGWLTFEDRRAASGSDAIEAGVMVASGRLPAQLSLSSTQSIGSAVSFLPSGQSDSAGSFVLCYEGRLSGAAALNLYRSGSVSRAADHNGNRIPESGTGYDLLGC